MTFEKHNNLISHSFYELKKLFPKKNTIKFNLKIRNIRIIVKYVS